MLILENGEYYDYSIQRYSPRPDPERAGFYEQRGRRMILIEGLVRDSNRKRSLRAERVRGMKILRSEEREIFNFLESRDSNARLSANACAKSYKEKRKDYFRERRKRTEDGEGEIKMISQRAQSFPLFKRTRIKYNRVYCFTSWRKNDSCITALRRDKERRRLNFCLSFTIAPYISLFIHANIYHRNGDITVRAFICGIIAPRSFLRHILPFAFKSRKTQSPHTSRFLYKVSLIRTIDYFARIRVIYF